MRKPDIRVYALVIVLFAAIVTGACSFFRPPAPKPEPVAPPVQPSQPPFDVSKYKAEPVVSVWLADKGSTQSMPLETYLEGVIAREMEPNWPLEALTAQAIVSRTLTLHAMEADTIRKLHNTDVSTSKEELQAFAPERVNENIKAAVRNTRGQILLYNGSLVNAIYSSCNGQISATQEESFPKEINVPTPYYQPVTDSCFQYAPAKEQRWELKVPGAEVAAAIGYTGNPGDITILEKGPSGRILYIGADNKKVDGAQFRKVMGYDRFRSTLVTEMTYDGTNFLFKGLGWGNGIGLCQWGAYTYAQQGMKAADIINHYYVGVELKKLWD